jgi:ATP-dependent DNA helicase DinG
VRVESARLLEAAQRLERALADLLDKSGELAELRPEVDEEREGLASLLQLHRDLSASLRVCLAVSDEDWVYWFEWGGERGLAAIVAAPLTVEEPLAGLWNQHYLSVVMTSATLAVGEDFTPFAESVGFSKVARYTETLVAHSPFRYDEQALVLTTPELPAPDAAEFPAAVARVVARIGRRVATKTLVLSTSYQLIERLAQELVELLPIVDDDLFRLPEGPQEPELLVQAPGADGGRLAERFRRSSAAILLATGSFWEGVDFPGRELEVLVVPRLPFAVPTEPLTEGRYERARRMGRDPFQDVALADAVLRLRQGVGRLLRSREDRGVVLLMVQRLQARAYGVTFLQSMPRTCELVPTLADMADRVVRFLRESSSATARRAGRAGAAEG